MPKVQYSFTNPELDFPLLEYLVMLGSWFVT